MKRWSDCWKWFGVGLLLVAATGQVAAESRDPDSSVTQWLTRLHEASRQRAYTGTFVVSAGGSMASAKIWHVCDGTQQLERVESLSGAPRSTFRRNEQVITFFPEAKVALLEKRASLGLFPNLLKSNDVDIGDHYQLRRNGSERIAGFDADIVYLLAKDGQRYGYRVWSEKKTGLVIQLQTVGADGRVIEQAAFSELQLDAPVSIGKLTQMMAQTSGYRVDRLELENVTAEGQGWTMQKTVAGFKPVACYRRPAGGTSSGAQSTLQWMFSDGLATVSLFVDAFDSRRHSQEGAMDLGGATHTLTKRVGEWWVTAVGEVPPATLSAFVAGLERKK
jgi:sigma-E factor negative regulatory protein RseB